ncbi:MAG: hypothetical protein B7Z72_00300 [Gemmatimonadetes bacterium 21-71-4]|nr:MAG: hypothetical protein B7Z72_00300 [Gemmatimonadetes bacterium 21-71-4]
MTARVPEPSGGVADTLRTLIFQPGVLTRARLEGRPTRYVALERLLLAFAGAYLVLVFVQTRGPSAPSPEVASLCASSDGQGADLTSLIGGTGGDGRISPAGGRLLALAGRALCDPAPFTRAFAFAIPIAFLLLIPLFAWLMQVAFRTQMPGFHGNWIYAVESHAALFALLTGLALESFIGSFLLGFLCSVAGIVYLSWNLVAGVRVAYGVSTRAAKWKTTVVGVGYAVCLVAAVGLLMWAMLARTLA